MLRNVVNLEVKGVDINPQQPAGQEEGSSNTNESKERVWASSRHLSE
jgi:hypothetical protein